MFSAVLAAWALGGCSGDDGDRERATPPTGGATASRGEGAPVPAGGNESAGSAAAALRLLPLGRFDAPTYLAAPRGDRRRFVVERDGRIVVVKRGRALSEPFLDISDLVDEPTGESGLLSMAFAPDYESSGRFYVYYTDNQGRLTIDGFRAPSSSADRADRASRVNVMSVAHPAFNHKGGQLQFGPDGALYAAFGDGGGGGDPNDNAQNLGRLLGKMVRVEPRPQGGYSVPQDNPFRGRSGARPEIFAYGLRNPYRFSFDRTRGSLIIGDVGQDAVEEIDYVPGRSGGRGPKGGYNFGWDSFEGRRRYEPGSAPGHVPPVIEHLQEDDGSCSIIAGYVIRDPGLGRANQGRYLYGDYCRPTLDIATLRRPRASRQATRLRVAQLVSFGEDGRGRVYAVSLGGFVYRIARR